MAKKVKIKTTANSSSVSAYLNAIEPAETRKEAKQLAKLFKQVSGAKPRMWGSSIIGYGRYTYYRSNGDEGEMLATGFSMRKSGPVLYIMPGYKDYSKFLNTLGPHKLGKSCLYLKNLQNIDLTTLEKLIKQGLTDLKKTHEVVMR